MHMHAPILRALEVSLQQPYAHTFREAPRFHARVPSTQTRGGLLKLPRFRAHAPATRTRGGQLLLELRAPHAASLPGRPAICSEEGGALASIPGRQRMH